MELVKNVVPAKSLDLIAKVPLWAVYTVSAHLCKGREIVAHMAGEDDLQLVSLYVRKAA